MEVSGRKHPPDTKPSTGDLQRYCEPCDGDGEHTEAGGYCKQCREFLCKACIKFHRRSKLGKLHDVLEGDAMPQTRPPFGGHDSTRIEICPIHSKAKEPIKFYCPTHNDIGCGDCIVLTHRTCKVDYIEDVSKGFKDSREFKDMLSSITTMEQRIDECDDTIKDTSKSNKEVKQTALESIRTYRAEILAYLDKREQELVKEIETMKADDDKFLAEAKIQNETAKKTLGDIKREIEINIEEENQLFISAKRRKSELAKLKIFVMESMQEVKSRRRQYKFNRDTAIEKMIMYETPIGALDNRNRKIAKTLNLAKTRCTPCKDIDIHTSEDTVTSTITGMALLTQNIIVLVDNTNKALKVVDTTIEKVISRLQQSTRLFDITALLGKTLAVTMVTDTSSSQQQTFYTSRV